MRYNVFLNFTPIPKINIQVLLLILLTGAVAQAQEIRPPASPPVFQGVRIEQKEADPVLAKAFSASAVYRFDVDEVVKYLHAPTDEMRPVGLRFGEEQEWNLILEPVNMVVPGATITIASESGLQTSSLPFIRAFRGVLAGRPDDSEERLTVNDDFLYGFVRVGDRSHFIEPLRYHFKDAAGDQFVLYDAADALVSAGSRCGNDEVAGKLADAQPESAPCTVCKEVPIGIASDFSMFQKYGSISGVLNHHIGVLNNVNGVYDNEFSCEIRFQYARLFFSTCSTCDPWTSSANAQTLVESFRNWGNNDLCFSSTDLLRGLWTNKDLFTIVDGNPNFDVIGRVYDFGTFCSNKNYHVLEDFATGVFLRNLVAHEIGHNLDCRHDYEFDNTNCNPPNRPPLMMDPSVSSTSTWSNGSQTCALNSVNTINNYMNGQGCIDGCGTPLADVWVDFNFQSCLQTGSFSLPYNLLQFGVYRVGNGGTINIKPSTSKETITITKPCTLKAYNGTVVIGQQ